MLADARIKGNAELIEHLKAVPVEELYPQLILDSEFQGQDTEPLWAFLHHCRNAGAHGGRFTFRNNHPKHPAIWGRYNLSRAAHEGMPLIPHRGIKGLFAPGDPLRLLWDIEQRYIVPTL